jgi:hypothetical protein
VRGADSPLPDIKDASLDADPVSSSEQEDLAAYGINERTLLRKIDWRLLPAVGILYLLSFLDRSNVGNARIEGLATDLHMTGNQYLTGLTLYFVGYVIFEVRLPLGLPTRICSQMLIRPRFPATSSSSEPRLGSGCPL